jgi:hypothetical protein
MKSFNYNRDKSQDVYILSTKETETPSTLSDLWETFTKLFKSDEILEPQIQESKDTNQIPLCKCPKTKSRYFCDEIYEIIKMTKNTNNKRSKELYENLLKVHESDLDIRGENLRQIKKDTSRTYSGTMTLDQKDKILNKLENVLRAFSNYDNSIKYCQGMNFIVGFFLYHCEEHIAFWLFVSLIEEYDLRSVFMENFPGLSLHVKRVEAILQNEYPSYWENFTKIGAKVEIFMLEWLFSLFSSLVPLELQIDFYKGFFSEGWIFFYKMCISTILNLKGKFSEADQIYIGLKNGKNEENIKIEDIYESWKKIIQRAYTINIKTDIMNINS